MKKIFLEKGRGERNFQGHPWIFDNEIQNNESGIIPGEIVSVFDCRKKFIGTGYYNPKSKITVRLLSFTEEIIDRDFFFRKIKNCIEYRKRLGYQANCRLVFGEGDFLPGLVVDKFEDVLVLQILTLGIAKWKQEIIDALNELLHPSGIYERSDVPVRKLEGIEDEKGFLTSPFETNFNIDECGVKFNIDVAQGQKTGFFLDQKENRNALQNIVAGANVLDCFCYTGSFSLFSAKYGAQQVTGLDISENAISLAQKNAALNGMEKICSFKSANAFDVLPQLAREKKKYDVIILDPPAFTKNRSGTASATRGYKEINLRAMQLLNPGGFLLSFSCSHFMTPDLFFNAIYDAATDAKKKIRQVEMLCQSKDHPVIWQIPETNYLKGFVMQVID